MENNQETPIITAEDAVAEWGDETRIVEPSVKNENGEEWRPEVKEEPEEEQEEEVVEEDEPEPPKAQIPDPGEFSPSDNSFEVTVFDDEGKKPRTLKIKSIEEWDELLEQDPNFGSAAKLLKAERMADGMTRKAESEKKDWDVKKQAYDAEQSEIQQRTEATNTMVAEINYLIGKNQLPAVDKKYENADWSDPEVAKQPGVKEQLALLSYMKKENRVRSKAGLKPLTSLIDAHNAFRLEKGNEVAQDNKRVLGQARKDAGARVAGATSSPNVKAPSNIMVGQGGNLRDLGTTNW